MSRSSKMHSPRYALTCEYPYWGLPMLLNHYKAGFDDLVLMRLSMPAELGYLMLQAARHKVALDSRTTAPYLNRDLAAGRRAWKQLPRLVRRGKLRVEHVRTLKQALCVGDSDLAKLQEHLRGLRERFYRDKDGVWTSEIQGSFATPEAGDLDTADRFTRFTCGHCGHVEIADTWGSGEVLGMAEEFEHLSGPYARCSDCGHVARILAEPSDEPPANWPTDLDFEWGDYCEHLCTLVDYLCRHLKAYGFPEPDKLRIEIGVADWRGRSAHATVAVEGVAIADALRVNGEYSVYDGLLHCCADGRAYMSCRFSHHDVPTGSSVSILPMWEDELEPGELMDFDQLVEGKAWVTAAACALLDDQPDLCRAESLAEQWETLLDDSLPGDDELEQDGDHFGLAVKLLGARVLADLQAKKPVDAEEAALVRACFDAWLDA